jgi:hypothetical protein
MHFMFVPPSLEALGDFGGPSLGEACVTIATDEHCYHAFVADLR